MQRRDGLDRAGIERVLREEFGMEVDMSDVIVYRQQDGGKTAEKRTKLPGAMGVTD